MHAAGRRRGPIPRRPLCKRAVAVPRSRGASREVPTPRAHRRGSASAGGKKCPRGGRVAVVGNVCSAGGFVVGPGPDEGSPERGRRGRSRQFTSCLSEGRQRHMRACACVRCAPGRASARQDRTSACLTPLGPERAATRWGEATPVLGSEALRLRVRGAGAPSPRDTGGPDLPETIRHVSMSRRCAEGGGVCQPLEEEARSALCRFGAGWWCDSRRHQRARTHSLRSE